jgi:hypothetical protein
MFAGFLDGARAQGTIATHKDNVLDRLLDELPADTQKSLVLFNVRDEEHGDIENRGNDYDPNADKDLRPVKFKSAIYRDSDANYRR